MRTNDSDGTENTTSALLDESETSEKEVLSTIITFILFVNTISALANSLILSADSLIVFSNAIKLPTNTIKRDKNKLKIGLLVRSKCEKLGLKFDKKTKSYA